MMCLPRSGKSGYAHSANDWFSYNIFYNNIHTTLYTVLVLDLFCSRVCFILTCDGILCLIIDG